jgi:hypothetical protein
MGLAPLSYIPVATAPGGRASQVVEDLNQAHTWLGRWLVAARRAGCPMDARDTPGWVFFAYACLGGQPVVDMTAPMAALTAGCNRHAIHLHGDTTRQAGFLLAQGDGWVGFVLISGCGTEQASIPLAGGLGLTELANGSWEGERMMHILAKPAIAGVHFKWAKGHVRGNAHEVYQANGPDQQIEAVGRRLLADDRRELFRV